MSTQHAQNCHPSKSLEYTSISNISLSCQSVITQRGSLNRSFLSVSCQSSLPHLSARRRSRVPERPRILLNDSSVQHATSAADKFGSIPSLSHLFTSSSSQAKFLSLFVFSAKSSCMFCHIYAHKPCDKKMHINNSSGRDMTLTTMLVLPSTCDTL